MPDFSLIMGTLGRRSEIAEFIESLLHQEGNRTWELIVVDQNIDDRVNSVLDGIRSAIPNGCVVCHIKDSGKGLSRARNIGLARATGRIVAFPDDDCVYGLGVLQFIAQEFDLCEKSHSDVLTLFDSSNRREIKRVMPGSKQRYRITGYNIFVRAISYTIFVRNRFCSQRFDERFGVGSMFGAAEETDYLYRLYCAGAVLFQVSGPLIYHPDKSDNFNNLKRARNYNVGIGAFFRKNLSTRSPLLWAFFVLSSVKLLSRLFQKMVLRKEKEFAWYKEILLGRLEGWNAYDRGERVNQPL